MADPKSIDELLALARGRWCPSPDERARVREFASSLSSRELRARRPTGRALEAAPTPAVEESRSIHWHSLWMLLAALAAPALIAGLVLRNQLLPAEGAVPAAPRGPVDSSAEANSPPATPQTWAPVRIVDANAALGQSLLAINPNQAPYVVTLANEVAQPGSEHHALVNVCVAPDGSVSSVKVLKSSLPALELQLQRVIPLWKYRPYVVNGQPTGFCYELNYRVGSAAR